MYGYQQCVKRQNKSILIILHALYSLRDSYCNLYHCFAVACSYLSLLQSFASCHR
jgi:hypothetical protein